MGALNRQGIKAQKLTWTQAWRRKNKKGKTLTSTRRRTKRSAKVFKAIAGISAEDIRKRRFQKPEYRKAAKDASLREIKERKKKEKAAAKKSGYKNKGQTFQKVPKSRRLVSKGGRR